MKMKIEIEVSEEVDSALKALGFTEDIYQKCFNAGLNGRLDEWRSIPVVEKLLK